MAERPAKRARRQISEDSSETSDGEPTTVKRLDRGSRSQNLRRPSASVMSRPRRAANTPPPGSLSRSGSDVPEDHRKSLKLTVKMPASKLREVTTPSSLGQSVAVNSRGSFEAGQIMTGKRSTRAQNPSKLKDYSDSEEEEDFGDEDEEDEEQSEDEDEAEEFEAETPSPQKPDHSARAGYPAKTSSKPVLTFTPADKVQESEKEVDEEEELSEPEDAEQDDNLDAEGDDDDVGRDEDAEGDVDMDVEGEEDSDDMGSGTGTPKLQTKRQRGLDEDSFLALPMEPQIKKHLTEDEHRMRRLEMARRRKNLSEKRNEEEKTLTINRLLKRQAPKRRGKAMNPETLEAATAAERSSPVDGEEAVVEKPTPYFSRWVNNKNGSRLGVPDEWFGKGVGQVFGATTTPKLVEEISEA